jgi:hypothetical protein
MTMYSTNDLLHTVNELLLTMISGNLFHVEATQKKKLPQMINRLTLKPLPVSYNGDAQPNLKNKRGSRVVD